MKQHSLFKKGREEGNKHTKQKKQKKHLAKFYQKGAKVNLTRNKQ